VLFSKVKRVVVGAMHKPIAGDSYKYKGHLLMLFLSILWSSHFWIKYAVVALQPAIKSSHFLSTFAKLNVFKLLLNFIKRALEKNANCLV
jgi:hypothetical protein